MAFEDRLAVEGGQEAARHLHLLAQAGEEVGGDVLLDLGVVEAVDLDGLGHAVAVGAVHDLQPVVEHVVGADEVAAHADGPGGGRHVDGERSPGSRR